MKIYFYFNRFLEWSLTVFQTYEFISTLINYKITHVEKKRNIIYSTGQNKINNQDNSV